MQNSSKNLVHRCTSAIPLVESCLISRSPIRQKHTIRFNSSLCPIYQILGAIKRVLCLRYVSSRGSPVSRCTTASAVIIYLFRNKEEMPRDGVNCCSRKGPSRVTANKTIYKIYLPLTYSIEFRARRTRSLPSTTSVLSFISRRNGIKRQREREKKKDSNRMGKTRCSIPRNFSHAIVCFVC